MTNTIDILVSYDNTYETIYRSFFRSSFNKFELGRHLSIIESVIPNEYNDSGFLSKRHIYCKKHQLNTAISYIKSKIDSNNETYAILCDVDSILFPSFYEVVNEAIINNTNKQFLFMSENHQKTLPNLGFIIFKTTTDVASFFNKIAEIYDSFSEKDLLNISSIACDILIKNSLPYHILDFEFINNNYHPSTYQRKKEEKRLAYFHATNCFNILDKVGVLNDTVISMKNYNSFFRSSTNEDGIDPYKWQKILNESNREPAF